MYQGICLNQIKDFLKFQIRNAVIFDFAVCNYIFCHILNVVHLCIFSLHLQYARIFKNAKFFADYFLVSAFSQEPDKTKWTVEESNLRRAGLQPAALPSELTVQIRRYKIGFSYFSPYSSFFLQHPGACSVSIGKKTHLTRLQP